MTVVIRTLHPKQDWISQNGIYYMFESYITQALKCIPTYV